MGGPGKWAFGLNWRDLSADRPPGIAALPDIWAGLYGFSDMPNPYARMCVMRCGVIGELCGGLLVVGPALAIIDGSRASLKLYIFSSAGAREGHRPP